MESLRPKFSRKLQGPAPRGAGLSKKNLTQSPTIVEIRDLNYAVNGRPNFRRIDMDIARGRVTAIMGPSGTGKTTLLRLITGQVSADSGSVQVRAKIWRRSREASSMSCASAWACCFKTARCSPT
jgi:ABC-type transporter Mla maintaining outer membrane lipid asymmetry ATPase subunit MlaF